MSYTIIIILITAIIVAGIAATAVQQHNERKEQQKREEISKYKTIVEETEMAIAAALQMPLSQRLIFLLRNRSLKALKAINEQSPMPELKQRIIELTKSIKAIKVDTPMPSLEVFELPPSDKMIIKYIQAVKKLRTILRNEHTQGKIPAKIILEEDKQLEKLQLRVNVETLDKRAKEAITNKMQGSARQYLEKAIRALAAFKPQDEYTQERSKQLKAMLHNLEGSVRDKNLQAVMDKKREESEDLDQLFAPKRKW